MKRASVIALLVGLAIGVGVIAWVGAGTVAESMRAAGWRVVLLAPMFIPSMALAAWSWRLLLPRRAPGLGRTLGVMWISLGVAWLAPMGQIAAEVVKAMWARGRGVPGSAALASVVADKTVQVGTQIVLALVGLALLAWVSSDAGAVAGAAIGLGVFALAVVGFMIAQARGMFRASAALARGPLKRFATEALHDKAGRADDAVRAVYADRRRLTLAALARLGFRLGLVIETYVALRLVGVEVGPARVLALEALAQAVRAGAFLVPAGVGVQEGAFVALGAALGIPAPAALAVSLCKRTRELILGVPALVAWQVYLGAPAKRSATNRSNADSTPSGSSSGG
ncbi:MAG: TIGR00374 family protein [Planctomycetota bacterium]|nr:MAG: TIGR00374 family protein [Planctomycetota bacterium]